MAFKKQVLRNINITLLFLKKFYCADYKIEVFYLVLSRKLKILTRHTILHIFSSPFLFHLGLSLDG